MRRYVLHLSVALFAMALLLSWAASVQAARPVYDQYPTLNDGPPPPPGEGEGDDEEEVLIRARPAPIESPAVAVTFRSESSRVERSGPEWIIRLLAQVGLHF